MTTPPTILFTGFEPSGDDHASAVIARIKARHPGVRICAWGGPKMEAAGAEIIEQTGRNAFMGVPGLAKIREHRKINDRVRAWLDANPIRLHVPVDSPAANFSICEMAKKRGARVVHLVAPQVWAWASWRVGKLRRLTDFVCCLLPFEEDYFTERRVPARFVGHPLFDKPLDMPAIDAAATDFERGEVNVALMPGSRPKEMERNFPLMLGAFRKLAAETPGLRGRVAATDDRAVKRLRGIAETLGGWPERLDLSVGQTDAVIRWCDFSIVVSGTVTLQIARQHKPMVVVYKYSRLISIVLGSWMVSTKQFSLPNLIAGKQIIPELIPYFGGPEGVAAEAVGLLERPEARARQTEDLKAIAGSFDGHNAADGAADVIARLAGLTEEQTPTPSELASESAETADA